MAALGLTVAVVACHSARVGTKAEAPQDPEEALPQTSRTGAVVDRDGDAVPTLTWEDLNDAGDATLQAYRAPRVPAGAAEIEALVRAAQAAPELPKNAYSGCHARADVMFRALAAVAPGKVFKLWLFSGHALSPALRGGIGFGKAKWDYHVAAAFRDEHGEIWVVDPLVLSGPAPVTRWVAAFEISGLAALVELSGDAYLFNRTEIPALDPAIPDGLRLSFAARNVLNGNFYRYEGATASEHRGAVDLALDGVSAALETGAHATCPWRSSAADAGALRELVAAAAVPPECRAARELFERERTRWIERGL